MAAFLVCVGALLSGAAANAAAQPSQAIQPPRDNAVPSTGVGILRGRVVAVGPGAPDPLRDARVSVVGPSGNIDPVFTDASGRFEFTGLPAGLYTLTAEKTGFVRTRYGSRNDFDPPLPVDVTATAPVSELDIRMPRGAAIMGRVVDELGEPIVGAPVSVGVLRTAGTETRLVSVARGGQTDDRGEYRVGGLAAGRYYVSIAGVAEGALIPGAPTEWARTTGWTRTFYPAAPTVANATPIMLGAGEEMAGIDMMLAASPPAKLTLSLVDATGAPATGLINFFLPGDTPGSYMANRGVPFSPANPNMVQTVQAGDWIAVAMGAERAVARVHLSSGEVTSLTLKTGSVTGRIAGRVMFDGTSPRPALTSLRIGVRGAGPDAVISAEGLSGGPVFVKADGTFELTGVAGTVELQVVSPLRGWMLRSVKVGDRDLLDDPLAMSGTEDVSGVQLILTDQLADVAGTVADAEGRPSAGCAIAMFPAEGNPGFGSRRSRLVRADQNGRFRVSDLPAGLYLAAAAPEVDGDAWLTVDYMRQLRAIAEPVRLSDREKATISLRCASIP